MPAPSLNNLHLQYRLWIAEMNYDINLIRIFNDYLSDMKGKSDTGSIQTGIEKMSKNLLSIRNEIDEIKNELHLGKMRIAALLRKKNQADTDEYLGNHEALAKLYLAFRKKFESLRSDMIRLGE